MVDKRGFSHLEMVLSFLFFIGFVSFLLFFLSPFDTPTLTGAVVSSFESSLLRESNTSFSRVFIKASTTPGPPSCFRVDLGAVGFRYIIPDDSIVKLVSNGRDVDSSLGSSLLDVDDETGFYNAFLSDEFSDDSVFGPCELLSSSKVSFGSFSERVVLSNASLFLLRSQYDSSYSGVKSSLGVPFENEFSLTSPDLPLYLQFDRDIPVGVDVASRFFVLPVLHADGSIINARFLLQVW